MARIRTIKPEFFLHERLAELSPIHRLLFIGLWTLADRRGRLEDRPKRIKVSVLPYDDCNIDDLLHGLAELGFVTRYDVKGEKYISIPAFEKHQRVSGKEAQNDSTIPPPPGKHRGSTRGNDGEAPGKHPGAQERSTEYGVQEEKLLRAAPAAADSDQAPPQEPAQPEPSTEQGFKLTSPPAQKPPPKPSEWEELRDRLDDARVRAQPESPDDASFCATRQEANALLSGAAKWLVEQQLATDRGEAKVLMRKAAWLYAADDWPGKQAGMAPWSLGVLLKRKHLAAYAARAREAAWKHDELEDLWHPASWSP